MLKHAVKLHEPGQLSPSERKEFIDFVESGGEVSGHTLPYLFDSAKFVARLTADDQLIGTAAIKRPYEIHVEGEFAQAGALGLAHKPWLELGWVHVHSEFRKDGRAESLLLALIPKVEGRPIYATTRSRRITEILTSAGFKHVGQPFTTRKDKGPLCLLVAVTEGT